MELHYNVTGQRRKDMVQTVAGALRFAPVYKGTPTFAYAVSNFTISRDGALSFDERAAEADVKKVTDALTAAGFETPDLLQTEQETAAAQETDTLSIGIPREKMTDEAIGNLKKICESKAGLFKKAFAADELPIEISGERISFPWFHETDGEAVAAYTHFITAICRMAANQKRVTAKEKEADNEKYAFRCFLLRLGFIGPEYKGERKILLKNLSGSSAFKNGERKEAVSNEVSE
ncbi:MAG: virulence protein [Ruminococcus flavefaciens]|nr:virulence protein [Ruminococcus flavefaciens]